MDPKIPLLSNAVKDLALAFNYQGRKTIKQVKKRNEEMPFKKELVLCSLIESVFNNNEFQALREFLSDQSEYPPQQCNKLFLNKLNQLAHKEMDKNQFLNVSLLLKVLQKFCKEDCDGLNDLIEHGLVKKISRIELVDSFLLQIGNGVTDFRLKISIRLEAIRTFNSLLDLIFKKGNIKFYSSEEVQDLMLDLAKTILEVGDYEIQVAISEALCRMSDGKMRETFVHKWFSEPIANAFMQIKDFEFETLKKPADVKLQNFWIDFNLGSRSVTFFIKDDAQNSETDLWETVSLSYEEVKSFTVEEVKSAAILIINLKKTLLVNKKEGKKVKIYFDSTFDILNTAKLVYGEEMMLAPELQHLALPSEEPQLDTAAKEMNHGENSTASEGELDRKISQKQHEEQGYHSDAEREHKSLKAITPLMETEPDLKQNSMVEDTEMETSDIQHNLTAQPERTKSNLLKSDQKKIFTEDSCSEGSEHSWLSMPQKKDFPRIADYSKQKKRKSSVLRVLPLFLESSEGKEQKEREVTLSKEFQIPSEEDNIPLSEQATSEFTDFQASDTSKVKKIKSDVGQQSANSPFTEYYNDSINMDEELDEMEQNAERSKEMEDGSLHDGNLSATLHGFTERMKQELTVKLLN
ncbi:synaptonemal complex protein 2-like [Hypanus sabinus]|uniref:synaptonemal complex protein 2-like n=1 Tax=Hypanus sabinus TaxID=79690 RepID=UPI0028C3FE95|nr:synaptonemal complex protein 2-like [Hypanus sabinus]